MVNKEEHMVNKEEQGIALLELRNIDKVFVTDGQGPVQACKHVSLSVYRGESFGIVGESGCGKTTLLRVLLQLIPRTGGDILWNGHSVVNSSPAALRAYWRHIQMVFQDSMQAFNPRMRVGSIICEPLYNTGRLPKGKTDEIAATYLQMVGLDASLVRRYPHEMSGGQRQRVAIARALAGEPDIIVFDEATSALDVSMQEAIAQLLVKLQKEKGLTYIFVAHDIAFVQRMCDRIAVMYQGEIVELMKASELEASVHPYTKRLVSSVYTLPDYVVID